MPCDSCTAPADPDFRLSSDGKKRFQVVLLGGAKVGKSAIISQFLYDKMLTTYKPTVEELYRGEYDVEGEKLVLDLLDTSGAHQFPAMRELAIKQSNAVLLVYAIDDLASWNTVKNLREEVTGLRGNSVPVVVVGNKTDLETSRQVPNITSEATAVLEWDYGWMETSAFDPDSILELFKKILQEGKVKYRLSPAVERRRKSLPAYMQKNQHEKFFLKRHSCNIS